jgi:beta-lactamase class A
MKRVTLAFAFALSLAAAVRPAAAATELDRLREALSDVVDAAEGTMGVAIRHLESDESVSVNGDERFPMASTFKVGILVELFHQVDEGKIRLEQMVELDGDDLHIGSGQLSDYIAPGVALSVENLALLMMRISDNSATDKVLELVGPETINPRLHGLGIEGVSVDRTCQRLILDWLGMEPAQTAGMSYRQIEDFLNAYQPEPGELETSAAEFEEDPRDSATPLGMNALLEAIFERRAASASSCDRMVEIMLRCDTGESRIKGLLPDSVQVAHKTGTLGGTVNDVGVLYLPDGRGHVLVSVLSRGMKDRARAERAIAQVARYAYDYFLFNAPAVTSP